jgi:hypothetical protein
MQRKPLNLSDQHPLQMFFIFASTFGSSDRLSASPGIDGPGVDPLAPPTAAPGDPGEFAVPKILVPGAVGAFAELPAPL